MAKKASRRRGRKEEGIGRDRRPEGGKLGQGQVAH